MTRAEQAAERAAARSARPRGVRCLECGDPVIVGARGTPPIWCKGCLDIRTRKAAQARFGVCSRCGAEHEKNHRYCYECYNLYRNTRWQRKKIELCERLGGRCAHCGWTPTAPREYAAFDFHHATGVKEFQIAGNKLLMNRIDDEIAKCELLCSNCHRIHHATSWIEDFE